MTTDPLAYCSKRRNKSNSANASPSRLPVSELRKHLADQTDVSMRGLSRNDLCKVLHIQRRLDEQLVPLSYNGRNSCYLDSAMVALFHRKSKFLSRYVINAQNLDPQFNTAHEEVKRVINKIQRVFLDKKVDVPMTCENLRRHFAGPLFKAFSRSHEIEWQQSQIDPVYVPKVLEFMYQIPRSVLYTDLTRSSRRPKRIHGELDSWMFTIEAFRKKQSFKDIFPVRVDDATGSTSKIIKSSFMYIPVIRAQQAGINENGIVKEKSFDPVIPTEYIQLSGQTRRLELVSILIHSGDEHGGHYTALLKLKDGPWVYYDDMAHKVQFAGVSLDQALRLNRGFPKKNSAAFVYM